MKVKISLRFVSWLDILDIGLQLIPYILFKLEEIKKDEAISLRLHANKLFEQDLLSSPFH